MDEPETSRGTGWVIGQFAVMAVIAAGWLVPVRIDGAAAQWVGGLLALFGLAFAGWAYRTMGRSFSPFPRPPADGELIETGPFALARHPIYGGGLLMFAGISIAIGVLGLIGTAVLAVLWWKKTDVEERHLRAQFPGYAAYVERVRWRLVPWAA